MLLDYELKRNLNRDLALLGTGKRRPERKGKKSPRSIGLAGCEWKDSRPDLRVEYETPELEMRHVDLELATRDYRPRAMAEKASAGFSLYGRSEDASRLRRVLDEREITARNPHAMNIAPAHIDALEGPRLHRSGSALSLHRSHAFRLLRGTSIPRVHRCPLGQANHALLEQTSRQANTPGPNAFQRAERSITCSPAGSTARSNAKTSATAANTKSNSSNGASQCSISFSRTRSGSTSKPSRKRSAFFCEQLEHPESLLPSRIYHGQQRLPSPPSAISSISFRCFLQ